MPIAFDAASSGSVGSATSLTVSHTCSGADRVLLAAVSTFDDEGSTNPQTPTATYNGVALTQVATRAYGVAGFNQRLTLLRLVAPATGANDLVISLSGDADEITAAVTSWTGVDQTTPFGTPVQTHVTAASISQNVSSESGDLVVDAVTGFDLGGLAVGAGQTERAALNGGSVTDTTRQSSEPGAATVTMSWSTSGSETMAQIAVNMNAVAGGFDPANLQASVTGDDVTLTWDV